jgi:hypothetical protein
MQQNRSEHSIAALSGLLGDVASLLQRAISALLKFVCPSCYEADKYRPEKYYMRGPGPKWRAKHLSESGASGKAEAALPFAPS